MMLVKIEDTELSEHVAILIKEKEVDFQQTPGPQL